MDPILKNLIRVGNVTALNAAKHQARVVFEDKSGEVSFWLDVLVKNSYKNKDYGMPDIGEEVVCLALPNGNAQGYIIGSVYSEEDAPPVDDIDKRHVTFEDNTEVEYDRKAHILTVKITKPTGSVHVIAPGNVVVTGDVIADGISLKTHTHAANGQPPEGGA